MKLQRLLAIGLAAVLSVSACLPVSVTGVYASETGSTRETAAEEAAETAGPGSEAAEAEDAMTAEEAGNTAQEAAEETDGSTDPAEADTGEAGDPSEEAEPAGPDGEQEAVSPDESPEDADEADTGSAEDPAPVDPADADDGQERDAGEAVPSDDPSAESRKDTEAERDEAAGAQEAAGGDRDGGAAEEGAAETQVEEKTGRETVETPAVQASEDDFANAAELTESSPVQVEVTGSDPCAYLKFTPAEDSAFAFYSLSDSGADTYATLFDESYAQVAQDDDGGEGWNFRVKYPLQAGHTYYLEVRQLNYGDAVFTVYAETITFCVSRNGDRRVEASPGEEVTFSVTASSDTAIHYQWYKDGEEAAGETGDAYTLVADGSHYIYCSVWDDNDENETVDFDLIVENHLAAYAAGSEYSDETLYVAVGQKAELNVTVSADDESALRCQWYREWEPIEGETGRALTTDAVTERVEYQFQVQDQYGNSCTVYFYIYPENHLKAYAAGTNQQSDVSIPVSPGEGARLGVVASADDESGLQYAWYKDDDPIEGAEAAAYTVDAVTEYTAFRCEVTDRYDNECHVWFYLYVENHLKAWPEGNEEGDNEIWTTVGPGKTKALRVMVSADDMDGLTYQWRDENNWEDLEGETSDTYEAGAGYYTCTVTDPYGNRATAWFNLRVDNKLQAYPEGNEPEDQTAYITVEAGQSKQLKVIATAEDMEGLTFRWERENEESWDWEELEGEDSDTLRTPVNTRGDWRCIVQDAYGNIEHVYFYVSIDNRLEVRQEGNDRILSGYRTVHLHPGEETTLRASAAALNEESMQFTWEKDGEKVEGAAASSLAVKGERNAEYVCRVRDFYGNSERVIFQIVIDNRLEVHPAGMHAGETSKDYDAPAKEGERLSVAASALDPSTLSYTWSYLDQNDWEWREIEGETGAGHAIRSGELLKGASAEFRCTVQDTYGNSEEVFFWFPSDTGSYDLTVYPKGAGRMEDGSREDFVCIGADSGQDQVTLEVTAEATDPAGLRYRWYDDDWKELAETGENRLAVSALETTRYICRVSDGHGNWEDAYFYVRRNAFWAYPEGAGSRKDDSVWINLKLGEKKTLRAIVSAEDTSGITYQWEKEYEPLEGETKADLSITGSAGADYRCRVSDRYGNTAVLDYYVSVGSLKISPAVPGAEYYGERYVSINMKPGEKKTLKSDVQAEQDAELSYRWIDWSGDDSVLGTEPSFEVTGDRNRSVRLEVSDQYGNTAYLTFYIELNHLEASADPAGSSATWTDPSGDTIYLAGKDGATLKVKAEADDLSGITYTWCDTDNYSVAAKGTDTIVVNPWGWHTYRCDVVDRYGNEDRVYFQVLNDSGLTAYPADRDKTEYSEEDNRSTVRAEKGTKCTLRVDASVTDKSALKYIWQSRSLQLNGDGTVNEKAARAASGWKDLAGNTDSLAVTVDADERYQCLVEDIYGRRVFVTFDILPETIRDLSTAVVTIPQGNRTYTGKAYTPAPVVKYGTETLVSGTDYTVRYQDNTNAGTAKVTVTGKGRYTGTAKGSFTIARAAQTITAKAAAAKISVGKKTKITASGAKETKKYTYTSSNTAVATVAADGTVTGKKAGTAVITVSTPQTANYKKGSKTVSITVQLVLKKPGNCHFVKWNNAKYNSCRIAWNKVDGATGYQSILSWTDGSHASTKILKSNVLSQDCSVTVNHVSQFKVRAFADTAAGRVYSPWSNLEYITPSPTKLTCKNVSSGAELKAKLSWNIIYGCNGYNVFLTTNPNGTWYWNQSTSVLATSLDATITKYRGSKLKKNTRYYVRIVTRRKRNGVFCTVPMPRNNTNIGSFVIK